jgi:hypothetical protein
MAGVDLQRIDCTDDEDAPVAALQRKWSVDGLPTVIVLDAAGNEVGRVTTGAAADLAQLDVLFLRAKR